LLFSLFLFSFTVGIHWFTLPLLPPSIIPQNKKNEQTNNNKKSRKNINWLDVRMDSIDVINEEKSRLLCDLE